MRLVNIIVILTKNALTFVACLTSSRNLKMTCYKNYDITIPDSCQLLAVHQQNKL